jgi:hypothetical protein
MGTDDLLIQSWFAQTLWLLKGNDVSFEDAAALSSIASLRWRYDIL